MTTRYYFWIVSHDSAGKPYLIYGDVSADRAEQKAFEMLGSSDFVIKRLPTKDIGRASQIIKGGRLESTHSIDKAAERMGHQKSINRLRRKAQAQAVWD